MLYRRWYGVLSKISTFEKNFHAKNGNFLAFFTPKTALQGGFSTGEEKIKFFSLKRPIKGPELFCAVFGTPSMGFRALYALVWCFLENFDFRKKHF